MTRKVSTGIDKFSKIRKNNIFYIDKTHFIKEWWDQRDDVTLITRPRRFGKTLMLDTVRTFFSIEYHDSLNLFNGLSIYNDKDLCLIQGKIPTIFISFSDIKSTNFSEMKYEIKIILSAIYDDFEYILDLNKLSEREKQQYSLVNPDMPDPIAKRSLQFLTKYLARQFGAEPIILLDEYDTPMQEAWLKGYWDEAVDFLRGLFNSTFKTNPWLGRGLMTGITRVSNESLFSDLNNLKVVTTTSKLYADCFGFTEDEVFAAMDEYGLTEKSEVKRWYDGFRFDETNGIYNPWSIIGYLSERQFAPYWAQTSSNAMVGQLIGPAEATVKMQMEDLLQGKSIAVNLDEQIVFSRIYDKKDAIWSFLMAAGYVKPLSFNLENGSYELALVNFEVKRIIENLVSDWFNNRNVRGAEFRNALLADNLDSMNTYMSEIA
ncbi:MAG: AAA family ATPase, partial [Desulfovibrio sp.]|nr:AAA family ATPase [Desulfovibrio sp.]